MAADLMQLLKSNLSVSQKLVRLPLRLIPRNAKISVIGGVNKGAKLISGAGDHALWLGTYEREKLEAMRTVVKSGTTAWDVGSNVGYYAVFLSRAVGSTGKVVAFEPMCTNTHYLRQHLKINKCKNVDVIQAAVSDRCGIISFSEDKLSSVGKIEEHSRYQIPSVTLDSLLELCASNPPAIIKIDVEGAEASVLRGASRLLELHQPEIWLALHGQTQADECAAILRGHKYRLFTINGKILDGALTADEVVARKSVFED